MTCLFFKKPPHDVEYMSILLGLLVARGLVETTQVKEMIFVT